MRVLAITLLGVGAEVLKIGGPIQFSGTGGKGKRVLDLWKTWTDSEANTLGFTVELDLRDIDQDDVSATVAGDMVGSVDVLVAPYTSGLSKTAIDAAKTAGATTKPILVWGGASGSIFTENCVDMKCFGTFTTADKYMETGIELLKAEGAATVGLINNANGFSRGVCAALKTKIEGMAGLSVVAEKELTVAKTALDAASVALVGEVKAAAPDVVAICGHNGDVEPVVEELASWANYTPKAILGTNIVGSTFQGGLQAGNEGLSKCLLMPEQWGRSADVDGIVGWTSESFTTAFGDDASYHAASMAAQLIAVTHAMKAGQDAGDADRVANLAQYMAAVDTNTFYGPVSFAADGSIAAKPMYTVQEQGSGPVLVAPTGAKQGELSYPLSGCEGWGGVESQNTTAAPESSGYLVGLFVSALLVA